MRLAYTADYALNAICPYFTMFPLEFPMRVLAKHRAAGSEVIDPFCGRGTTLFAARTLGLDSWGIDSSPVAVAIARAKLSNATAEDALCLAQLLIAGIEPNSVPTSEFFQTAYHARTLRDICALREGLMTDRDTDGSVLLRAAVLGCLHGPLVRTGASYLSNQMPRTYASKPDYALKYWAQRAMKPPFADTLLVLERKLRLISKSKPLKGAIFQRVKLGDSTLRASLPAKRKFSVVVTSPPYYGMRTYVQDQWLRNWFLGGPANVDYSAGTQLQHTGQQTFAESLGKVWANMARTEAETLDMYVRFGVIPSAKVDAKDLMAMSVEASRAGLRIVSHRNASSATAGKRQAKQMMTESGACDEFDFHVVRN